jgi:hypothetical protein
VKRSQLPDGGFPSDGLSDVYASSITEADAEAIETFLVVRLDEVAACYRSTALETRVAQSPYEAAGYQIDQLRDALSAPTPQTLREWLHLWNSLVHILEPWRGTPGHDGERWRLMTWIDGTAPARAQRRAAERQRGR